MKQSKRCMICTILLLVLLVAFAVPVLAATTQRVISLPAGQAWKATPGAQRTGNYSYAHAENQSVFPSSGKDLYELIHCRILNTAGTLISENSYVVLNETNSGYTKIDLREGYLSYKMVVFEFRANSTSPATAVVSYDPL